MAQSRKCLLSKIQKFHAKFLPKIKTTGCEFYSYNIRLGEGEDCIVFCFVFYTAFTGLGRAEEGRGGGGSGVLFTKITTPNPVYSWCNKHTQN